MEQPRKDFDYTMMSCYQTCQRRYDLRHNRGLVPKHRQYPLDFGGAIHSALDVWYNKRSPELAIEEFKRLYRENLEEDDKRTIRMGEWILNNYHQHYRDQPHKLVAVERSFDLPLPNGNNLIGRIDKIVEWDSRLWVMDHKTTSSMGQQFAKNINPNLQFTGYVWAARELGYEVVGVLVDALLVAKGLLESSSRSRLTPLARFDLYRSPEHISEWRDTILSIQDSIARSESSNTYVPSFDACTYYGECPYRRVCKEDSDIRERIISMDYDVDHWDPREEKR